MKDIKSMIIGFLLATCMFLFIGATSSKKEVGRYQAVADGRGLHLIDTTNGQYYQFNVGNWWKKFGKSDIGK